MPLQDSSKGFKLYEKVAHVIAEKNVKKALFCHGKKLENLEVKRINTKKKRGP